MNRLVSVLGSLPFVSRRIGCGECLFREGWTCRHKFRGEDGPIPVRDARVLYCHGLCGRRRTP